MSHPLLDWIEKNHPHAHGSLRGPADADAVDEAGLPEGLSALYLAHDGQEQRGMKSALFDEGFSWLPLAEGQRVRREAERVLAEVRRDFPETEGFGASWFPFAADDLGNLLVVDTDADDVFVHLHDEGRGDGPRTSAAAYLDAYLARLESGELIVDERLGVIDRDRPAPRSAAREPVVPVRTKRLGTVGLVAAGVLLVAVIFWLEVCR